MSDFFGRIYELFSRMGLYGSPLEMYLYGYDCEMMDYSGSPLFGTFGLIMLLLAIVPAVLFYHVIDHPRFNKSRHWLLVLGVAGLLLFVVPWFWLDNHLTAGKICADLVVNTSDITGFAAANTLLGLLFYTAVSFIIRSGSRNGSCTPFKL